MSEYVVNEPRRHRTGWNVNEPDGRHPLWNLSRQPILGPGWNVKSVEADHDEHLHLADVPHAGPRRGDGSLARTAREVPAHPTHRPRPA